MDMPIIGQNGKAGGLWIMYCLLLGETEANIVAALRTFGYHAKIPILTPG